MNAKRFPALALALAAVAALALLAVACGGGEEEAAIRIQKGLSVSALAQGSPGAATGQVQTRQVATGGVTEFASGAVPYPATVGKGGDLAYSGGFAPYPFPAQQFGQTGITVQGFGSATADADSAILELSFGSGGMGGVKPMPMPYPQTEPGVSPVPGEIFPTPPGAQPITEADLQPVIDAIVGQGVARSDIEFIGNPYYDPYFSSATLRVTVGNIGSLEGIVQAATGAAAGLTNIYLQNTSISYTVSDCVALEKAAMLAAAEDAKTRGTAFAQALGVGLGPVTGASHYSYSPFGPSPCDAGGFGGFKGPYPMGGMPYAPGQPSQVQVVANVSVTYAIQ